ncbi:NAC transcription factor 32-like [Henckelia pumila]|uniref:NAC transcription factor 32-like n=1 Tax=Henckelia pumila TaxID=405737 RepID=UPI003C6E525B
MEENPIRVSQFPPGVRFHPSDEELITYYLQRKVKSLALPANVIADIELYNYNPWDLPRKAFLGDDEWYFFTPRDRKYPNGGRPNRTARSGYWKATGTDKPILNCSGSRSIGVKKALVFYKGKPPKGVKMDWIMTEYRMPESSRTERSKGSMRLDDWVLCRIRRKGNKSKNVQDDHQEDQVLDHLPKINDRLPWGTIANNIGSRDILVDYLLSNEFHVAVSLLTGHDPKMERISGTSYHEDQSDNIKSSNMDRKVIDNRPPEKQNKLATFSLIPDCFNSFPGQGKEDNWSVNLIVPTDTMMNEKRDEVGRSDDEVINVQDLDMPELLWDDFIG